MGNRNFDRPQFRKQGKITEGLTGGMTLPANAYHPPIGKPVMSKAELRELGEKAAADWHQNSQKKDR